MKRVFYIFLTLAFVFSACGKTPVEKTPDDNQGQEQNDSTSNEEPLPPAPPVAEPMYSPEGSIENDIVYAFMSYGPYEKFGAKSYFYDPVVKATAELYKWKADDPKGITVTWDGDDTEYKVSISTPEGLWYEEDVTGNKYSFKNLIPGVTYSYTVTSQGTPVKDGSFTPTGQVRMVDIPCTWNYRDQGGWTGLQGKKVRYGQVYRGGCLNGIFNGKDGSNDVYDRSKWECPDSMRTAIARIGIKAELDLRGDLDDLGLWGDEHSAHGNTLRGTWFEGVDFIQIMTDYGLYHPMQRSSLIKDMAWIIAELKKGNPVAYHCRSGADRTGALAILVLGVLGVSDGDLARDYELTSISTEKKEKKLKLASDAINTSPDIFRDKQGIRALEGDTLQEKIYRYLNQHFDDVHINADDLDWYIKFMLGLDSYEHPSWAKNYEDNALEKVWSIETGSGVHVWPDGADR